MRKKSALIVVLLLFSIVFSGYASATIIAKGGPIHGANGIAFNSDDKMYVGSIYGSEVVVLQENVVMGGEMQWEVVNRIGVTQGVQSPDDVIFAPDGTFYVTMPVAGLVARYSAAGELLAKQFVGAGVNPIALSDDGRLFVGLAFYNDALYQVDPALVNPPVLLGTGFGFLNSMEWGPDGYLYAPAMHPGKVVRINVNTVPVTVETVAEGFSNPSSIKFNSENELFVISKKDGKLYQVYPDTGAKKVIAQFTPKTLDSLAFDSRGRMFVSSSTDGTIYQVKPSKRGGSAKVITRVNGGLVLPSGVAVLPESDGHDTLLVADMAALRRFDGRTGRQTDGDNFCIADSYWDGGSEYDGVTHSITVSPAGPNRVVVTSWVTGKVQIWDTALKQKTEEYSFDVPINATMFQGNLVIADMKTHSIVRKGTTGFETILPNLGIPAGLAAFENHLWVSDRYTGVVWEIVDEGGFVSAPVPVATGLSQPEGIARDANGDLLVIEAGAKRLSRIDVLTHAVSVVREGLDLGVPALPFTPPTFAFNGVAVGNKGAIYVSGDSGNLLYRFSEHE